MTVLRGDSCLNNRGMVGQNDSLSLRSCPVCIPITFDNYTSGCTIVAFAARELSMGLSDPLVGNANAGAILDLGMVEVNTCLVRIMGTTLDVTYADNVAVDVRLVYKEAAYEATFKVTFALLIIPLISGIVLQGNGAFARGITHGL